MVKAIFTGKITLIANAQIRGSFESRKFYVEEQADRYPQTWELECHQGDCNLLDQYFKDDVVKCEVTILGHWWPKGDKAFNALKVLKIELVKAGAARMQSSINPEPPQDYSNAPYGLNNLNNNSDEDDSDSLPF